MTEYARGVRWYLSSDTLYDNSYRKPEFHAAANFFVEIWNYSSGYTDVRRGTLEPSDIVGWVEQEFPRDREQNKPSGGLRLMISLAGDTYAWRDNHAFDEQNLIYIMEKFHLPVSYLQGSYFHCGCYSRHSLSELAGNASDYHLGFNLERPDFTPNDHDLAFTWSAETKVTQGLLRVSSEKLLQRLVRGILSMKTLASHPAALGVVLLENLVTEADIDLIDKNISIGNVQIETGHFGGFADNLLEKNSKEPPDYSNLSLKLSRLSQMISLSASLSKSTVLLSEFLLESMDHLDNMHKSMARSSAFPNLSFQEHAQILRDHVRAAASKSHHHLNMFDHYRQLCLIQNQTVYNLIAQRDVQQNIELAKDSKSIAAASKRDSSAMTSISFLTMVVLPGTFISSLFAIPLFNWDASSWRDIAKPRFWFYWAITIPLTVLVLISWFIFQRAWSRRGVEIDKKARDTAGVLLQSGGGEFLQLEQKKWLRDNRKFPARKRYNGSQA